MRTVLLRGLCFAASWGVSRSFLFVLELIGEQAEDFGEFDAREFASALVEGPRAAAGAGG